MSLPFSLEYLSLTRSLGWRLPNEAAAFSVTLKVASFGCPLTICLIVTVFAAGSTTTTSPASRCSLASLGISVFATSATLRSRGCSAVVGCAKLSPRQKASSAQPLAGQLDSSFGSTSSFLWVRSSAARSPFPHLLESPFHKRDQRTKVHWLTEDIERPQAHGLKPQLVICRDGDQDHQRFWSKGPKLLEHCQTIQTGHFP